MSARGIFLTLLVSLVVYGVVRVCEAADDGLRKNFYKNSCPKAEQLVRDITWRKAQSDDKLGAKLLRMHYHDCFVRVCRLFSSYRI